MAHLRERQCLPIALKKLSFSPVLAVQGMRQTGKSVFVRELLSRKIKNLKYVTLDSPSERKFAMTNPESFLAKFSDKRLLAIDEAQKAPLLFDTVKLSVDNNRRPGMFILLGSTEFSKMTFIRESLTGRMSRLRIYPLNLSESCNIKTNTSKSLIFANEKPRVARKDFIRYLERGGMPGIFSARDDAERIALLEDWLALTLERDLHQIPKLSLDSELARNLFMAISKTDEPTAGMLAKQVGAGLQKTKLHLDALCTLFVIQKIPAHQEGTGKPMYFLGDVSFVNYFNASFERQLQTWLLQEISSSLSYRGEGGTTLSYYRGTRGGIIDLVLERRDSVSAIKVLATDSLDERDLQGLLAWKKKNKKINLFALGGLRARVSGIEIFPWEAVG